MKLGTKIKKIAKIQSEKYQIWLEYTDGFKGKVDLGFLFSHPPKNSLMNEIKRGNLFSKCFMESGALAWANGYELCPDALRNWIIEQRSNLDDVA